MKGEVRDPVGKMTVRTVEYDVFLDLPESTNWSRQGGAHFTMTVSGKDIRSDTWEGLYKLAMVASKEAAVKVNIPLLRLTHQRHSWDRPTQFEAVALTGKHQKNGNFLIRVQRPNGKATTEQTDRWLSRQDGVYFKPMSKEAQAEGLALMEADRKAGEALSKWRHDHEASLDKLYDAAEQEAMEKLDREEGRE